MKNKKIIFFISTIVFISLFLEIPLNNEISAKDTYIKSMQEKELLRIDKEFSEKSYRDGILSAFLKYTADEGIIIREKQFPIKGKKMLIEFYENRQSTNDKLIWIPLKAEICESGELGYTYGEWNFLGTETNVYPVEKHGHYVTVWKKNQNDEWKFIFYIGNSTEEELIQFRKLN
jgi:ketosteroid isomerase-like protein